MSRRAVNGLLLLVFLGSLGLHVVLDRDLTRRNFEVLPDMAHSPAYGSLAPNPIFPDGATFQSPQPGTIPRGPLPLHFGSSPAEALRAGAELHNPFPAADERTRERGTFVYQNYCLMCHGREGKGDGPVSQRGFPLPASLLGPTAVQMKDGQMFHVLTYGQRNMPAHASLLSREDRWKVILYIRWRQQAAGEKRP
jgi:mono/diheme cytochrome c family protein